MTPPEEITMSIGKENNESEEVLLFCQRLIYTLITENILSQTYQKNDHQQSCKSDGPPYEGLKSSDNVDSQDLSQPLFDDDSSTLSGGNVAEEADGVIMSGSDDTLVQSEEILDTIDPEKCNPMDCTDGCVKVDSTQELLNMPTERDFELVDGIKRDKCTTINVNDRHIGIPHTSEVRSLKDDSAMLEPAAHHLGRCDQNVSCELENHNCICRTSQDNSSVETTDDSDKLVIDELHIQENNQIEEDENVLVIEERNGNHDKMLVNDEPSITESITTENNQNELVIGNIPENIHIEDDKHVHLIGELNLTENNGSENNETIMVHNELNNENDDTVVANDELRVTENNHTGNVDNRIVIVKISTTEKDHAANDENLIAINELSPTKNNHTGNDIINDSEYMHLENGIAMDDCEEYIDDSTGTVTASIPDDCNSQTSFVEEIKDEKVSVHFASPLVEYREYSEDSNCTAECSTQEASESMLEDEEEFLLDDIPILSDDQRQVLDVSNKETEQRWEEDEKADTKGPVVDARESSGLLDEPNLMDNNLIGTDRNRQVIEELDLRENENTTNGENGLVTDEHNLPERIHIEEAKNVQVVDEPDLGESIHTGTDHSGFVMMQHNENDTMLVSDDFSLKENNDIENSQEGQVISELRPPKNSHIVNDGYDDAVENCNDCLKNVDDHLKEDHLCNESHSECKLEFHQESCTEMRANQNEKEEKPFIETMESGQDTLICLASVNGQVQRVVQRDDITAAMTAINNEFHNQVNDSQNIVKKEDSNLEVVNREHDEVISTQENASPCSNTLHVEVDSTQETANNIVVEEWVAPVKEATITSQVEGTTRGGRSEIIGETNHMVSCSRVLVEMDDGQKITERHDQIYNEEDTCIVVTNEPLIPIVKLNEADVHNSDEQELNLRRMNFIPEQELNISVNTCDVERVDLEETDGRNDCHIKETAQLSVVEGICGSVVDVRGTEEISPLESNIVCVTTGAVTTDSPPESAMEARDTSPELQPGRDIVIYHRNQNSHVDDFTNKGYAVCQIRHESLICARECPIITSSESDTSTLSDMSIGTPVTHSRSGTNIAQGEKSTTISPIREAVNALEIADTNPDDSGSGRQHVSLERLPGETSDLIVESMTSNGEMNAFTEKMTSMKSFAYNVEIPILLELPRSQDEILSGTDFITASQLMNSTQNGSQVESQTNDVTLDINQREVCGDVSNGIPAEEVRLITCAADSKGLTVSNSDTPVIPENRNEDVTVLENLLDEVRAFQQLDEGLKRKRDEEDSFLYPSTQPFKISKQVLDIIPSSEETTQRCREIIQESESKITHENENNLKRKMEDDNSECKTRRVDETMAVPPGEGKDGDLQTTAPSVDQQVPSPGKMTTDAAVARTDGGGEDTSFYGKPTNPKLYSCDADLHTESDQPVCRTLDEYSPTSSTVKPQEASFRWRYAPSLGLDDTAPPQSDDAVCPGAAYPALSPCTKPVRVGLSRRQRVPRLHPYLRPAKLAYN